MDKLLGHVKRAGYYFRAQLEWLATKHTGVLEIRGLGLMLAMELESADRAKAVVRELLGKGIIINRTHEAVLRFLPPYIVKEEDIDHVIQALDAALSHQDAGSQSAPVRKQKSKSGSPS